MGPVFTKALETIVRVLAQVLLVPFFKSVGEWVVDKYKTWQHRRKTEKEIKKKVDAYKQAETRQSAQDSFNKLP